MEDYFLHNFNYFKFLLFIFIGLISFQTFAQQTGMQQKEKQTFYIFFDQKRSYVQNQSALIAANYITTEDNFDNFKLKISGSEKFCKNIFYFSNKKINFFNPSVFMKTYAWCQIDYISNNDNTSHSYKFILNKTFESWCDEKETNPKIGNTVQAILDIFESNDCGRSLFPILAETKVLNLSNTEIEDVSPIADFLQIRSLWLDNNKIKNIEPLGAIQELIFLSLNNNSIENAQALALKKRLKWLFMNNNQIKNVSFLTNLKGLKFFGISNNLISDPTPILSLMPSTYVLAKKNPFLKEFCKDKKNSVFLKSCEN